MSRKEALVLSVLPRKKTKPSKDLMDYSILIIGDKKVGKTRLASFIDGALILSLEPASTGRPVFQRKPEDWMEIRKIIRALEKEEDTSKFPAVVFDTFDVACELAADYICDKLGIESLGEHPSGKSDYGMSHGKRADEVLRQLLRIERTGRTVVLISHTKIRDLTTISGVEYQKIMPSTSPSILNIIKKFTQMNFMLDFARVNGQPQRIILTQGDEHYFAGCGDPSEFPPILPLLHCREGSEEYDGRVWDNPFELLREAFKGNVNGIDPKDVNTILTSAAITDESLEELEENKKEVKRKKKKAGKKKKQVGRKK